MGLVENLTALGLTNTEARIYLALLELGETRTGKLCDKLDIPNSHIYRQLDSLIKRGLVSYRIANNMKIFEANEPESLSLLYQKKREELREQEKILRDAIPKLKSRPKQRETVSDYKYFESVAGIKALWLEIGEILIPNSKGYYSNMGILNYKYDGLGELSNWDDLCFLKKQGYEFVDFGGSDDRILEFKKKFKPHKVYKTYIFSIVRKE